MIKALWFACKIILISIVVLWIVNNPGYITVEWANYTIEMHSGVFLIGTLVFLTILLSLQRFVLFIKSIPQKSRLKKLEKRKDEGAHAVMMSLSAHAVGDVSKAEQYAHDLRRYYGADHSLSIFLEAQAAMLSGDEKKADSLFHELLNNHETAFLGLRGLMLLTMERGSYEKALTYALRAKSLYPRQPWIIQIVYTLQIKNEKWDDAIQTILKNKKIDWMRARDRDRDLQALYTQKAEKFLLSGDTKNHETYLKKALKISPDFIPAVSRLAKFYVGENKKRSARKVIEKAWAVRPHPSYTDIWMSIKSDKSSKKPAEDMKWVKKLIDIQPDTVHGHIAHAKVAMKHSLWGEARAALDKALDLYPDAETYKLLSQLSDAQGYHDDAKEFLEKASNAEAGEVWTCAKTGLIYDKWNAVAKPHNSFNTIVWGHPVRVHTDASQPFLSPKNDLFLGKSKAA